jgi:hypothetical protein
LQSQPDPKLPRLQLRDLHHFHGVSLGVSASGSM